MPINYGTNNVSTSGNLVASSGNFTSALTVNNVSVSVSGHTHVASNITDFNSSVSGLLPTISNSGDNRLLTSTGSSVGVNAESNLTFNGSLLSVSGNLVANTGTFSVIQLDTDNGPVSAQGQLAWNDTEGTVDIALTNSAIINVGEHEMYRVRNTTGDVLYKGQAVYASGVHSNGIITPNLYQADGLIREIRFIGLVYENINHNNNGYAINFGHMNNIDTRGNVSSNIAVGDETWADGDILYVHPTVAGKLTNVEPKHSIATAIILDAANSGKIFVRPTSYGHLDDNHDVAVSGATNGQFLQYNSSTDYWVASSSGNFSSVDVSGVITATSGVFTQRLDAPLSYYTVSPEVSGTVNDWNPGAVADVVRASGTDSARINGLIDTYGADAVLLYNVGSSGDITLTHASGTADNQFLVPWLGDYVLGPNGGAALIVRDKIDNKWRIT